MAAVTICSDFGIKKLAKKWQKIVDEGSEYIIQ